MENERGFSMAAAIELRDDLSGDDLRHPARGRRDAKRHAGCWRWRSFLMAAHERRRPGWAGSFLQIVRDWVLRYNAEGPEGLVNRKAPTLRAAQRAALAGAVESCPEPWRDGVVR
jgi:hypothetical protein